MYVVGTAGHVDHGKSALVAALTGTHPDRLKEEQTREMTIELGFAWFNLPSGEAVGIVDVPGHRDFIENMLAGAGGMDAAILVIAADEGVMPQTREHLAILDLLHIQTGLVAITKCDLAESTDWLDLIESEIHNLTVGTRMAEAPVVRVSARTGFGLDKLIQTLADQLSSIQPRLDHHRPRLPVDRVFTMQGFGTVVTGTLMDGVFHIGDDIEVLPGGKRGRIRGLQTHKKDEESASPGQRTAVNLSGISLEEIHRGDVLSLPGKYISSRRVDAEVELLADCSMPLLHHSEVKFFLGAKETVGYVRLLNQENLPAGSKGFVQLELRDPVAAYRGDRFILRRPSPGETIGGGVILDAVSSIRLKRFSSEVIQTLEIKLRGDPKEDLLQFIAAHSPLLKKDLISSIGVPVNMDLLEELVSEENVILVDVGKGMEEALLWERNRFSSTTRKAVDLVKECHNQYPLKPGIPREELKCKLGFSTKTFGSLLGEWTRSGLLVEEERSIRLPDFEIRFSPEQASKVTQASKLLQTNRYSTPSVKEMTEVLGESLYLAMIDKKLVCQVSAEVVFDKQVTQEMVEKISQFIRENGTITLAQCRDLFQTSRKYAQAILEYMDQTGITAREGDFRKLR
jgi:selenocysteine-specific elongation factor